MSGNGKLTKLLTKNPVDPRKLLEYARSKKLDFEDLGKLAVTFSQMVLDEQFGTQVTPLHVACSTSKPDIVAILVKEGWDINKDLETIDSPLRIALDNGNIPIAHLLLELGADIKSMNRRGSTPMMAALSTNKKEKTCLAAVKLLLEAGVSVNASIFTESAEKPIHCAIINNLPTVVSFLLQMGADANSQDINGSTPLHCAVYNNNRIQIIKLLARHGVDFYVENVLGDSPLQVAVKRSSVQTIKTLVGVGYDINKECSRGLTTALHTSVYLCSLEIVKLLIDLGANPDKVVESGVTPLHVVATRNLSKDITQDKETLQVRKDMAEVLVEKGAKLNATAEDCDTPLVVAVRSGFMGLAKFLMKLGANVNLMMNTGETFFHVAVTFNRDIIVHILEHGGDYSPYNKQGLSPYHLAISLMVDVKFIKSFVSHGCPYNQDPAVWNKVIKRCNWGAERFFAAEKQFFKGIAENNLKLVKKAVKDGALPNGCGEELEYPLHYVALKGYKDILTFLLEEHVPPNSLNNEGETPLYIAAKLGYYEICCTLLRFGACYNYYSKKCPKPPKLVAADRGHKDVSELLHNVGRMFALARLRKKLLITELEKKLKTDVNGFLMFINTINNRGGTLMSTALQHNCIENVRGILELHLRLDL